VTNTVTGQVTRFVYDGDGNRILRMDGSGVRVYIGDYYEKQGAVVTKYYYAGGQRIAMRQGNTLYFLHGDHLGSATVATDASGNRVGELRYTPYGVTRYEWGSTPTNRRYTGQPWEGVGLYDYGARMYSPSLGRFVSADVLVPNPAAPQSLNRYAYGYVYGYNNPVKYLDPSGHDPIDAAWEQAFYAAHGSMPTDQDRRDRFFSILYSGSGPDGAWTDSDWILYNQHRAELWSGTGFQWPNASAPGLDRFITHLERLATYYQAGEENLYAQAIGFIWGGVPLGHAIPATWQMATNPGTAWTANTPLFEGTAGWDPALVDDENPSHHYAGLFYLGYFYGPYLGCSGNWLRDGPLSDRNVPDLNLGYIGVQHGAMLHDTIVNMSEVGTVARFALDPTPGIWALDTPGMRVPWYYPRPWAR